MKIIIVLLIFLTLFKVYSNAEYGCSLVAEGKRCNNNGVCNDGGYCTCNGYYYGENCENEDTSLKIKEGFHSGFLALVVLLTLGLLAFFNLARFLVKE